MTGKECEQCLQLAAELAQLHGAIDELSIGAGRHIDLYYMKLGDEKATLIHPDRVERIYEGIRQHAQTMGDFGRRAVKAYYENDALRARVAELEALVGTVRDALGCPPRNVRDVDVEQHSREIVGKLDASAKIEALLKQAHRSRIERESGHYGDLCDAIDEALGWGNGAPFEDEEEGSR